jgi:hypothetical protein
MKMKLKNNLKNYGKKSKIIVICMRCDKHLIKPNKHIFICPCKKNTINFKKKNSNTFLYYIYNNSNHFHK